MSKTYGMFQPALDHIRDITPQEDKIMIPLYTAEEVFTMAVHLMMELRDVDIESCIDVSVEGEWDDESELKRVLGAMYKSIQYHADRIIL